MTFSPEGRPTFRMDTLTYLLSLSRSPQDEWRLREPPKEEPGGLEEHERELTQLLPEVWVEDSPPPPRLAKHQAPVIIELKPGTIPVRKRQYPLPIEAWAGILPHINRLKQAGILVECQSAWNTPIQSKRKEDRTIGLYRTQASQPGYCDFTPHCSKPLYLT